MNSVTKFRNPKWLAGLATCFVLAACAPVPTAPPSTQTPAAPAVATQPAAQPPAAADAFPVTLAHKYGTTTIARQPTRIAVVGLTEQDALLALGITPVGTTEWFGKHPGAIWPWAQGRLGDAKPELIGDASSIKFETIAALKPDVILALYSGITQENYELLSKIAPTVAQPKEYVDYGIPWQELTRKVGQVVGQAEAADALVADVEAQFARVRADHPQFEGATAIVATPYEGIWVYGSDDVRGRLLTSLGFKLPEGINAITGKEFGGNLSMERADLLDVDAIIWLDAAESKGPLGGPLYASLDVAKQGREVFLSSYDDPLGGATSFVSVLSLPYLLDGLVPMLAAAVDGDPKTVVKPTTPNPTAAPEAAITFPITIKHEDGETTFTQPIKRIVTLSEEMMEMPLVLGIQPVGTASERVTNIERGKPFKYSYSPAVSQAEIIYVGKESEPSFEAIAALKPDLIITPNGYGQQRYATLSKIAPTLTYDGADRLYWKEGLAALARLTGKVAEAQRVSADFDAALAQARAQLEPVVKTKPRLALLFLPAPTMTYMVNQQFSFGAIFAELGMDIVSPDGTVFNEAGSAQVSNEPVALLPTDAFVIFRFGTDRFPVDELLAKNPAPKLDYVINPERPASGPITDFDYLRDLTALLVKTS